MPFPLIKVAYMAIKQISKPIANAMKRRAKDSPFLRNTILIPPAQFYHRIETSLRMRTLLNRKLKKVQPLNDEIAVELGADMFGEIIVFSVALLTLFFENYRQKKNEEKHETSQDMFLHNMKNAIMDLELRVEEQDAKIRELNRLSYKLQDETEKVKVIASRDSNSDSDTHDTKILNLKITKA